MQRDNEMDKPSRDEIVQVLLAMALFLCPGGGEEGATRLAVHHEVSVAMRLR